jgi:hypothetical protein
VTIKKEYFLQEIKRWRVLQPAGVEVEVGLTMGYNFCTIRFKDRSELGSGFISSHF